jgi:hypothetical protein
MGGTGVWGEGLEQGRGGELGEGEDRYLGIKVSRYLVYGNT